MNSTLRNTISLYRHTKINRNYITVARETERGNKTKCHQNMNYPSQIKLYRWK